MFTLCLGLLCSFTQAQDYELSSPSNAIQVEISLGERLSYSVQLNENVLVENAEIGYSINSRELEFGQQQLNEVSESSQIPFPGMNQLQ